MRFAFTSNKKDDFGATYVELAELVHVVDSSGIPQLQLQLQERNVLLPYTIIAQRLVRYVSRYEDDGRPNVAVLVRLPGAEERFPSAYFPGIAQGPADEQHIYVKLTGAYDVKYNPIPSVLTALENLEASNGIVRVRSTACLTLGDRISSKNEPLLKQLGWETDAKTEEKKEKQASKRIDPPPDAGEDDAGVDAAPGDDADAKEGTAPGDDADAKEGAAPGDDADAMEGAAPGDDADAMEGAALGDDADAMEDAALGDDADAMEDAALGDDADAMEDAAPGDDADAMEDAPSSPAKRRRFLFRLRFNGENVVSYDVDPGVVSTLTRVQSAPAWM